jgi:hypothetical protein
MVRVFGPGRKAAQVRREAPLMGEPWSLHAKPKPAVVRLRQTLTAAQHRPTQDRVVAIKARLKALDAIAKQHGLRFSPGGATKLTAGGLARWNAASQGGQRKR